MSPDDQPAGGNPPSVVTPIGPAPLPPGVKWMPREGVEAAGLISRSKLDEQGRSRLLQSAAEILGSGVNPVTRSGSATGLIVGQVQSGKTMSFTTVIALARDNGFPLVVLIGGGKDPLLTQSHERLARDLDVEGGDGLKQWKMRKNIRPQDAHDEELVRQTLENWADATREPDEKATLLLTVLKQNQRLQGLTNLLGKFDLSSTPVLIIDDEADQASLNNKINQGQESTTYTRLQQLRRALPCHTYLQYTATPQAPLLINIADTLSPDFVRVLQPGDDYVGGGEFFAPRSRFIRNIPAADIPPRGAFPPDPPASMLEAMRLFFVGLAASRTRRSMLIHPSRMKNDHRDVIQWVTGAKDEWHRTLQLPPGDPDRVALIEDFQGAYSDLATTAADLPPFSEILARLPRALRNTTPIEFNTNGRPKAPEINWRDAEGWILVGGQAVDRGFTVELLTVTYMPRGLGVGNADTLQQRARFFGYKRRYLGLCRVFLEPVTRSAFENYVEHEEIMRRELQRFADTGENLHTWRRRLVLSADLKPCRKNVISDDYTRARPGGGWSQQRGAEMSPEAMAANTAAMQALVDSFAFEPDTITYVSTEVAQQHELAHEVPLRRVVDMLVEYRLEDAKDTAAFTGILVALGEALSQNADASAVVYRMRPRARGVSRTTTGGLLAEGFQQGRTALSGGGTAYPGDIVFRDDRRLTLQLHTYDLTHVRNGPVVVPAAPLIAIHIPPALARAWLVQISGWAGNCRVSGPFSTLLAGLSTPASEGSFHVLQLPESANYYAGRDASGAATLLIRASGAGRMVPLKLAGIEARFGMACRVAEPGGSERTESLTAVLCLSRDPDAEEYFAGVVDLLIGTLGPAPDVSAVAASINELVDLFQKLRRPPRKPIIGLVGELLVIACAADASAAVAAWRTDPGERYDFAIADLRVESKTSSSRARVHFISAEQANPPAGIVGLLASAFVEPAGGGTSLEEFLNLIETKLTAHGDVLRLRNVVADTLGGILLPP